MPKQLTAKTVEALVKPGHFSPGRHTDRDGLHLYVRADGKAAWVLRYRIHGKQKDMGLGGYPGVGLAEARIMAREAKAGVAKGIDPALQRRQKRIAATEAAATDRTFTAAAAALMEAKGEAWRNAKHSKQWTSTLTAYVYPVFGSWPVSEVDTNAVLKALQPLWTRAPETASRVRGRIEAVLDFAGARGWRSGENPARWRGHLCELLPSPRKVAPVNNWPSLPWQQVPAFLTALGGHAGISAQALRFMILTAARSGEVRGAQWLEFDLEQGIWTIPAIRMKARKLHRVPLSEPALALLGRLADDASDSHGYVFPGSRRGRPLSDMALSMLVSGMAKDGLSPEAPPRWRDHDGRAIVPHGFRTSFRGWTRAKGWPDHLGELALAHSDKDKVRAAYARDDLVEERRPMMLVWADHCCGFNAVATGYEKVALASPQ